MGYKNKPRPYKKEYQQQKARGETDERSERQRARRKMDKTGKDANKNGKADKREGKDIARCTLERQIKGTKIQGVVRGGKVITTNPDAAQPCPG